MLKLTEKDIVLFSGDSITDGNRGHCMDCNHIMGHGYQTGVASALALENAAAMPKFINKGYSGATMHDLLNKWDADVLQNRPTLLSLLIGTNDCTQGVLRGLSAEEIAAKYRAAVQEGIDRTREVCGDLRIVLCEPFYFPLDRSDLSYRFTPHPDCEGPFGRPDRNDTDDLVNARVQAMELVQTAAAELAAKNHCVFVPLRERFENMFKQSKREYFIWDGTHPTIAGHALIAKAWLEEAGKQL